MVLLLVVAGVVAVTRSLWPRAERVTQPIAFNHAVHIEDAGLECLSCHTDAETAVHAGLPRTDVCLDCHDPEEEEILEHPEKAKLVPYAEEDQVVPWKRVAITKPDVFFSHRRHVAAGGIECERCHVGQSALTAPPSTVQEVLTMDECLACHEASNVSNDCLVCHR
jgi:predicted CXXCH cytochrome family protein